MSRNSYVRICALLAAADFLQDDLAEFAHILRQKGARGVYQDIARLKADLNLTVGEREEHSSSESPQTDELAEKVQRLLFDEARLTKLQAFEMLSTQIRTRHPGLDVPPDPKKGFSAWVRRLATFIPESELLHLATTIRNAFVHDRPQDWRLK